MLGKHVSAAMMGPDASTKQNNGPELVGHTNEAQIFINGKEANALIDTGSCVSTVNINFYNSNLNHLEMRPVSEILNIECADGKTLPYHGYIETTLNTKGIPKQEDLVCLFLVVSETPYNSKTPILLGTNILNELMASCKQNFGELFLQKASLFTPWYLAFRCITVRNQEVKRNKDKIAIIRSAEPSQIILGPNQTKNIRGVIDKELNYHPTCAIIQETDESNLPNCIDITPSVVYFQYRKNKEITVNVSNLTTNTVAITPKAILAELQPVNVDEAVFEKIQDSPKFDLFNEVTIETTLTQDQDTQIRNLLLKHQDIFSKSDTDIGHCKLMKHRIDLINDTPFKQRHRRIPPAMVDEVRAHLEQLLSSGVIQKSKSPWCSNIVLVRKKNGKIRMCVDYRMLNQRTVKDAYALPRIEEVFDVLQGSEVFSTIDMKSGYHQIEIEETHRERSAFTVGPLGFYEYIKMPFGLSNSPATYQRVMEECLGDLNMKICIIYLDDLIIFSKDFKQHLERLDIVLTRLKECNLKLSADKCFFIKSKVKFLGHVVGKHGVETDPDKVEKVKNWPTPKDADSLRSFIAFVGYYRKFIRNFSKIAKPLTDLLPPTSTKKGKIKAQEPWNWGPEQETVFNQLKETLMSPPILAYPNFQLPFELHIDASTQGLGAILYQDQDGTKRVIAYASRSLSRSEKNYSAFKLEFLALKWAVTDKFSDYLLLNKFIVYTDNNPLTHILTSAKLDATGQRWASALGEYNFDIVYRAGLKNGDADGMSRYPYQEISDDQVCVKDQTIKAVCSSLNCTPLNIIEVTDSPSLPLAQIETRELRKSQREDPLIGKWIKAVVDKQLPHKKICNSKSDISMKKNFQHFLMIRGILYRETIDNLTQAKVKQLVLPEKYKMDVLRGLHTEVGHPSKDRTLSLIRERFFWPGVYTDVEKYVGSCDRCLRRKSPTNSRAPLNSIESTYPLELVCMDFLTVDPCKGGYGNILVITDHYTKYALAIPTHNQTAKTTAEALYNNFIVNYGVPSRIHSDQGRNFESNIIAELCKLFNIDKSRTTPYHAMGNGISERYNRTLLDMLGTLQLDQKPDWKKYLPTLVFAYNSTKHETTKFTPYELMFGRKPRLPIDFLFETPTNESSSDLADPKTYVEELKQRIKSTQEAVKKISDQARSKQKHYYDRKAKAAQIKVGDTVLVRILAFEGKHKIEDKFEKEACKIIGQPNPDIPVFDVKSEDGSVRRLHRNHLYPLEFLENEPVSESNNGEAMINDTRVIEKKNMEDKRECLNDVDINDEEDSSGDEIVLHTFKSGDAWTPSTYSKKWTSLPKKKTTGDEKSEDITKKKVNTEKDLERKDKDESQSSHTDSKSKDLETELDLCEEIDLTQEDESFENSLKNTGINTQGESEIKDSGPRKSERVRKKPKWMSDFQTYQMTTRSVDSRLKALQSLFNSGILDDMSTEIAENMVSSVWKH